MTHKQRLAPPSNPNARHLQMLLFLYDYSQQQGRAPTIREIGQAVGMTSTSVVNYNLAKLAKWGYLERTRKSTRGVRLLEYGYQILGKSSPQDIKAEVERLRQENRYLRTECQRLQQLQPILAATA